MNARRASRIALVAAALALAPGLARAASGIFQTYIVIDRGSGNEFFAGGINSDGAQTFHTRVYGTFAENATFVLKGGEVKTFKNGISDVFGARLYYTVYKDGNRPGTPTFTEVNLPFDANLGNGDQRWKTEGLSVNLLESTAYDGTYVIEVYWRALSSDGDHYDSNSGNNYTATYTVNDDDTTAPEVVTGMSWSTTPGTITDAQIVSGGWTLSGEIQDSGSGVNNNGSTTTGNDISPNFDLLNNADTQLITDRVFPTKPGDGSASGSPGTLEDSSVPAIGSNVDLGTYKVRVSAADNDEDRTDDRSLVVDQQVLTFSVTDDDTTAPTLGTAISSDRAMDFRINDVSQYTSGTGTNAVFTVTDAQLSAVSGGNTMRFVFNTYDAESGITRASSGVTNELMNFDVGDLVDAQNIIGTYSSSLSSNNTTGALSLSIFEHNVAFSSAEIRDLLSAGGSGNTIQVSVPNADQDRGLTDVETLVDAKAGTLVVEDDDPDGPVASIVYIGTDYTFGASSPAFVTDAQFEGGLLEIAFRIEDESGVFVSDGTQNIGSESGNVYVNYDLMQPDETVDLNMNIVPNPDSNIIDGTTGAGGVANGATNIIVIARTSFDVSYDDNDVGVWRLAVSTQDHDSDQGTFTLGGDAVQYDRAVTTNQLVNFTIVDDDTTAPTTPGDLAVVQTAWTNVNSFTLNWTASTDPDDTLTEVSSGIHRYRAAFTDTTDPEDFEAESADGSTLTLNVAAPSQGTHTVYLYAVDADNDRAGDREKSANASTVIRYDATPPTNPSGVSHDFTGLDDTSEVELSWTTVSTSADGYSDWAGYRIHYSIDGSDPTTSSPFFDSGDYAALGNIATDTIVLTDLQFGEAYKFLVVGTDAAGNASGGEIEAVQLELFAFTSGTVNSSKRPVLNWNDDTREYTVIYYDSQNFSDSIASVWTNLASVTDDTLTDSGQGAGNWGTASTAPENLPASVMRFYRLARPGHWEPSNEIRYASEDVYVFKNIDLRTGQNWVSLPGIPDDATVAGTFGTTGWPVNSAISWFGRGSSPSATNTVVFNGSNWAFTVGGSGNADSSAIPHRQGCMIQLPPSTSFMMPFVGRVPKQTHAETLEANPSGSTHDFNLLSVKLPRRFHPSELGLLEAGFQGGGNYTTSDRLYKYDRANQRVPATIYYRTTDQTWRFADNTLVPAGYFSPDDGIVVRSRMSNSDYEWTNILPYTPPTKLIDP